MRLGIIGCCKSKGPSTAPARALYTGDLFTKSLAWAERHTDHVIVLSALYGVVELGDAIAPYELTLNGMPQAKQKAWARDVGATLAERYPLGAWEYTYLTGVNYHRYLPKGAEPMAGLPFGKRLQWLKEQLK